MTYHGEYKVPGGKLVKVDFEIADGKLTNVMLSGDFFLYPEEAYDGLRASLEGMPASLDVEAIADRVGSSLDADVEVLGTSPMAIATAVRRALDGVTVA